MENFEKISINDFEKYENNKIIINNDLNLVSKVEEQINENINIYYNQLKESLINCESPIEQMLSLELESLHLDNSIYFNPNLEIIGFDKQCEIECNKNKYRVDILIPVIFYRKIYKCFIIECDGHEFHQKNKEQVKKDNIRQRDIEMSGYKIIRFSGSEIYNDAYGCALEILKIINNYYKQIGEEYGYQKNS